MVICLCTYEDFFGITPIIISGDMKNNLDPYIAVFICGDRLF